jgi:predicted ATPase/DNA-binding CsgD family transcriptional regulator
VADVAQSAAGGVYGFGPALTSFVGRAEAVRDVAAMLEEHRLVTVAGPGGVGKTRLAAEVTERVAPRFADGAWLAELAGVRDPAQVAPVVAVALGVRDQPGIPVAEALTRVLARRQMLLVLDNCEHVIGAAAALCAELAAACDDLRILATSREPLRIAGEASYRLAPLALPDPADPAGAATCEAVALFSERAGRADAHFVLGDESLAAVARLVGRLDGMPLAIELAAARVEALGVSQLLDRIDDRFKVLVSGDRLAAGRQQSLAAAVQWSYELLSEREQRLFRALSVFPGPFTLDAVETVAGADAEQSVLRLVDCSLVSPPQAGVDGQFRYSMLETLRAYGGGLLAAAGEFDAAAAGLAEYMLRIAGQAAVGLRTEPGELAAARLLDAEDATLRQVLAWAMRRDQAVAWRLAVDLTRWWFLRGRLAGQYPLLSELVDTAKFGDADPGSPDWSVIHFWLGWTAMYSADLTAALGHFTAVIDVTEHQEPPFVTLVDCLAGRALTFLNLGRLTDAIAEASRSLDLARKLGYTAGATLALASLSIAAENQGDLDRAVRLARQAEQDTGDVPGWVARARSNTMAGVLTSAGDFATADRICSAGIARSREANDLLNLAPLLTKMVTLDLQAGRLDDAAAHLREALEINLQAGGRGDVLNGLDCCGFLCAASSRHADAVTVWAVYNALLEQEGYVDSPADALRRGAPLRDARRALGPVLTRAAEQRGAAMGRETATEYALMLAAARPFGPASPGPFGPASLGPRQAALPSGLDKLSGRERELVSLVAHGRTDAQIAAELYISLSTVRSHLDRIRDKTGCRRRADLTRMALSEALV